MEKNNLKKIFYVALTTALGGALAIVAHAFLEIWLIDELLSENVVPIEHWGILSGCYLPNPVKSGLLAVGLISGFLLGLHWWQLVYVRKTYNKRRWWREF